MIVLVTHDWPGLGVALLLQRQGADVVCAYDYRGKDGRELESTERIGDGLVTKMPLETARRRFRKADTLWLFDDNSLPQEAEQLRAEGEQVLGTSALGARLENDRAFAMETAASLGFDLPLSAQFRDYEAAIAFLAAHPEQGFAYKPDKQDPTQTYVPQSVDDPAEANQELQEYLHNLEAAPSPRFVLQQMVQGVEANFELWLGDGKPLLALCDLEAKRKLVGDLGENIGCAADYVFQVPVDAPVVTETVSRYLASEKLADYTGSVDVNVIFGDGKTYFLENCMRFGYNAYPTLLQELLLPPVAEAFARWVAGADCQDLIAPGLGASLTLVADHPRLGTPMLVPPELREHTYLYRAYADERGLHMVERWPEVLCVTGYGDSPEDAGAACLDRARQVSFPNKGYRVDLADATMPTVPVARYRRLQELGWLEPVGALDNFPEGA